MKYNNSFKEKSPYRKTYRLLRNSEIVLPYAQNPTCNYAVIIWVLLQVICFVF